MKIKKQYAWTTNNCKSCNTNKEKTIDYTKNRDFTCDVECENCGEVVKGLPAYNTYTFFNKTIPFMLCPHCEKSSKMLEVEAKREGIDSLSSEE